MAGPLFFIKYNAVWNNLLIVVLFLLNNFFLIMTLKEFLNEGDKFAAANGIRIEEIRENYASATMKVTDAHSNAGGICQGGAVFTLADLVFAALVNSRGYMSFAINSTIYYHLSGQIGDKLTAEGSFLQNHPKIPAAQVIVKNQDGVHIATFTAQGYSKKIENHFDSLM